MSKEIYEATATMAYRYKGLIINAIDNYEKDSKERNNLIHLYHMCNMIVDIQVIHMYDDKISRWLGFIQGVLYAYGLIDIEEERNYSRPIFHEAYEKMSLPKPPTLGI